VANKYAFTSGKHHLSGSWDVLDLGGLNRPTFLSAFTKVNSVIATKPCWLGAVGDHFLADSPKLASIQFLNMSFKFVGHYLLRNSGVTSIDLGGLHVASVGNDCFRGCSNLTSVVATSPCKLDKLGNGFLADTPKLAAINFANVSFTSVGSDVLRNSGVATIDLGGLEIKTFNYYADSFSCLASISTCGQDQNKDSLASCIYLTSVIASAPCSLGEVGNGFLADTPQLASIKFFNMSFTSIGAYLLRNSGVTSIDLGGLHVASVGNDCFRGCSSLASVVATSPCKLDKLGDGFLRGTSKLESINFANMSFTSVGWRLLYDSGMTTLDLGGLQVASLGKWALRSCANLTSVLSTAPCSLGTVGDGFLADTPKLAKISFANMSLTSIGQDLLRNSGIPSLDVGGLHVAMLGNHAFAGCSNLVSVIATTPCTLGAVGDHLLADTPKLASMTFANMSVTSMGSWLLCNSGVVKIDLGGLNVDSMGQFAFLYCCNLASVFASSPCRIGKASYGILSNTPSWEGERVPGDTFKFASITFGNMSFASIGRDLMRKANITALDFGGLELASLGCHALQGCCRLTSVVATSPCCLGTVGDRFLADTAKLASISFVNMSFTTIGCDLLRNSGVATIDLGGLKVKTLSPHAFSDCSNLTEVVATMPCTVRKVGKGFLANTPKLRTICFANMAFQQVGSYLLRYSGVVVVDLAGLQLESLGRCALNSCANLTSVIASAPCTLGEVGPRFLFGSLNVLPVDYRNIAVTVAFPRARFVPRAPSLLDDDNVQGTDESSISRRSSSTPA
jgi:hypothetical protein